MKLVASCLAWMFLVHSLTFGEGLQGPPSADEAGVVPPPDAPTSPSPGPSPVPGWGSRLWEGVTDLFDGTEETTLKLMARAGDLGVVPVHPRDTAVTPEGLEFRWINENPVFRPGRLRLVIFENGRFLRLFELPGTTTSFTPDRGELEMVPGRSYHWLIEAEGTPVVPDGSLSKPAGFQVTGVTPSPTP